MSLPEVPRTLKPEAFLMVVVVPAVNLRERAFEASEKLIAENELAPVILSCPVDPATV